MQDYIIMILILLLCISIFYCIKFALIIIKMQDAIENSLDEIDNQYNRISKILEIPLFYDSPEIKRVLLDLEEARNSLLYVANTLNDSNSLEDKLQQDEQDN
jgi:hypothetical protein